MKQLLSNREQQILRLIAFEKTTEEIAGELFISGHTAMSHRKKILRKLQVKNAAGLVRKAFELGLLTLKFETTFDQ